MLSVYKHTASQQPNKITRGQLALLLFRVLLLSLQPPLFDAQ